MKPTIKQMIPFIISLALFMEAVDGTIINTAIPTMALSLHVYPIDLKIALISYLLSLAIFIPISGWIADKFGIKRVFIFALTIFTLSSAWCGFANNLLTLVIARTLQGIGGSFTMPVGRLILIRTFERHELIAVMNKVIMVAAIGVMLGPVLGGFITHYISWHWIFWVNIPIGLFTILLAWYWFDDTAPEKVPPLDKLGFILFGSGLAGLTFGLSAFSETTINRTSAIKIVFGAIILLSLYMWHSRKQKYPIVKTVLLKTRTFQVSVLGNLFSRLGFGGMPFLIPLLLQIGLRYPAQLSGILLAPMALGVLLIKPFSLQLLRLFGFKRLLIINTLLVATSIWLFILINNHTSMFAIGFLTFLFGFLISLQYSGMNSLAYADVAKENLSNATSIMSTMQQLAQSFGVAVGALLINYYTPITTAAHLSPNIFHQAFFALGLLTLISILVFIRLKPDDGHQMIKAGDFSSTKTPVI